MMIEQAALEKGQLVAVSFINWGGYSVLEESYIKCFLQVVTGYGS